MVVEYYMSCDNDFINRKVDIMYCMAILSSGNHAIHLCRILEKKGYVFEVVSTPCQIAKGGCGYSLKFPCEYRDMVMNEAALNKTYIREIYKVIPGYTKNRYERVY